MIGHRLVQVGLGVAVERCLGLGIEAIWGRIQRLAALMREGLARIEGVTVQDLGATLCGIVSFTKVREPSPWDSAAMAGFFTA